LERAIVLRFEAKLVRFGSLDLRSFRSCDAFFSKFIPPRQLGGSLNLRLRYPQCHLTLYLHALKVVLHAFLLKLTLQLVDPIVLIDLDARPLLLLLVVLAVLLILLPVV